MPTASVNNTITLSFSVKDRAKSCNWYRTHFGFEEIYSADEMGWTEIATNTPGVTIGFGDAEEVNAGNCVPVFGSDNLDVDRKNLEAAGIKFDGDTMVVDGMVKLATLYDPDGNALMLAEDLSN